MKPYEKRRLAQAAAAVAGVDAGKFEHTLVIRPRGGADSKPVPFPVTREGFERAVRAIEAGAPGAVPSDVVVGIEFAGSYGFTFAHYLHARGYHVVSVLAAHTKHWKEVTHRQPLKTDAKDALVITDLVAQGNLVGFAFLARPFAELRFLVSAREHLTTLRTAALTRLIAVLDVVFPEFTRQFVQVQKPTALAVLKAFPGPEALLAAPKRRVLRVMREASQHHLGTARYTALIKAARDTLALPGAQGVLKDEIPLLVERLELYDRQLAVCKARMVEAMQGLPEAQALLTIPGVAPVTAGTFLGVVGDPRAYESSAQILKLAGLSLVEKSSGVTKGRPRISKRGRPVLRRQAFMFALRAMTKEGIYRADYERLIGNNGGRKLAAIVALSRKALKLMYGVARERRPYMPTAEYRRGESTATA
jgi:transposase